MGKEWAKVRLSFVLSFLAVLLLLPVCAYLGYSAGAKINYTYLRSKSFSSLGAGYVQIRAEGSTYALRVDAGHEQLFVLPEPAP